MRRLLLCTIALAAIGACQVRGDLTGPFTCVEDPACPDGFTCVSGVCMEDAEPDGGPMQTEPCGLSDQLSTSFDGNTLPAWAEQPYVPDGGTVAVSGGDLVMTVLANDRDSRAQLASYALLDMSGRAITIEVSAVAGATTEVGLLDPSDAEVYYGVTEGDMFVFSKGRFLQRRPYSATADRWWRVREEGTTMIWETSPDGAAWVFLASDASPINTRWVRLELSLQAGAATPAGTARWGSINLGVDSTVKWCSLATLEESLTDGTLAPTTGVYGRGCTATESGGKLLLTGSDHGVNCVAYTTRPVDVRDSTLAMEIGASLHPGGTRIGFADWAGRNYVSMEAKDKLYFYVEADDVDVLNAQVARNDATQKFWRIVFAGTQIRFEVSPDGTTWNLAAQAPDVPTFDGSALFMERSMYIEENGPLPTTSTFGARIR
jgi:hypothetical protein